MSESDRYLDELRRALPRGRRRRVVAEIRSHLSEGIAAETANGLDPDEAERVTIERLGPAEQLAAQFTSTRRVGTRTFAALAAGALAIVVVGVLGVVHTQRAPSRPQVARLTTAPPARVYAVGRIKLAQNATLRGQIQIVAMHAYVHAKTTPRLNAQRAAFQAYVRAHSSARH